MDVEVRKCARCGEFKPISAYSSDKGKNCLECKRMVNRQYAKRWRQRNIFVANPRKENITGKQPTLCWTCKNAYGGCSWTEVEEKKHGRPIRYEPVKGWVAIQTKNECFESFCVLSCPEYEPDDRREEPQWK